MGRERDLFRAIVISALALVPGVGACGDGEAPATDAAAGGEDAGPVVADASTAVDSATPIDAATSEDDAGEDAMVLIL